MSVPELKQKKIARDQVLAKAAAAEAAESVKVAAALEKTIFAKAQGYEAEYNAVSTPRRAPDKELAREMHATFATAARVVFLVARTTRGAAFAPVRACAAAPLPFESSVF